MERYEHTTVWNVIGMCNGLFLLVGLFIKNSYMEDIIDKLYSWSVSDK